MSKSSRLVGRFVAGRLLAGCAVCGVFASIVALGVKAQGRPADLAWFMLSNYRAAMVTCWILEPNPSQTGSSTLPHCPKTPGQVRGGGALPAAVGPNIPGREEG